MFQSYLKIAWRNLLKHKSFSIINILGLAIGVAACLMIFLYVHNELTFDLYNTKADRIARVVTNLQAPEGDMVMAISPTPLTAELKNGYPEVESAVRLRKSQQVVQYKNEFIKENDFYTADPSVFSIFSFYFKEGYPPTALEKPYSIVLTESMEKKYFGDAQALGKTMNFNGQNWMVTGVIRDRPVNSDLKIDALMFEDFSNIKGWLSDVSVYSFILFRNVPDLKRFQDKLNSRLAKTIQQDFHADGTENYMLNFQLESLADVHFSQGKLVDTPKGNKLVIYVFSLLAAVILFIALLNYINLSTAKSAERAKEVGIRKVSGAGAYQLIQQFLFESFLLVSIAWTVGIGLVFFSLPFFNTLLQTQLSLGQAQNGVFLGLLFIITFILSGLYPAFVLSGFKPVAVLKGSWKHKSKGIWLRKTISISQFALATCLIVGTIVIYSQMKFIQEKDLGFNKDQVLAVYTPEASALQNNVRAFHNTLRQRSEVREMTISARMTDDGMALSTTTALTDDGRKKETVCNFFQIDPQYLPVFQIHLLEGRNLSDSLLTDKNEAVLVNEAFVKMMGWKSGLGKQIELDNKKTVVGVVKNFYYRSLHNLVEPLAMSYIKPEYVNTATVKIDPRYLPMVRDLFKKYFPSLPFEYDFYDDIVAKRYEKDRITMTLFKDFTFFAIFVSCLGLYGLVTLIAAQRTKEVGIRKVLGATLTQLFILMTKDFLKLIFWALFISLPVAGYLMNKWLANYAYHIALNWLMFLIPAILVFFIALSVVSWQIIKAALMNPVKSLRAE